MSASANTVHPIPVHPSFRHLRREFVESLNLSIDEFEHIETGAQHFHLAADNNENVFLVGLRTVPTNSRGVAHILEHTALCGSKRYPVRDPFFMMIRRSLNTFMNAFTSSDWTAYPFASQNRKDFFNLLDVYLDAVFFSNLDELDFAQEGHRIEFATPDDPTSDLTFKGIVFNEMKGAMSSPITTLWQALTKYTFPTNTYHFNSGGEPADIPDLSYADLKDFYKKHYHPSNAIFMTYGDISAVELQQQFEERVLSHFEKSNDHIFVPDEKRIDKPFCVEEPYALGESEQDGDKTHIVLNWLLGPATDLRTALTAELLEGVLLEDSASPLQHVLETTELGTAPSPLCGLDNSNKEMTFICGVEGSSVDNVQAVEDLIISTLQDIVKNGIPQQQVEAVLHQLELQQREITGGSYPYGLQLILDALPTAVHYGETLKAFNLEPVLAQLRKDITDPRFIPRLIQEQLLNNPHRVRLTLIPDANLDAQRDTAEKSRLAKIKANLSDKQQQHVVQLAQQLEQRQNQQDDESILPKVGLEDVPAQLNIATGSKTTIQGRPTHRFEQGTNGIIYQQLIVDLPKLDDELIAILPYYTNCLTELGCGKRDYLTMQALQSSVSGGVGAYTSLRAAIDNEQDTSGHFILSGKALARNHRPFNELMRDIFHDTRFDEHERIRELMAQQRASREQGITSRGHSLVMQTASAGMSPAASLKFHLSGLQGISNIKQLDDTLDDKPSLSQLMEKMAALHGQLHASASQFLLIGENESLDALQQDCTELWCETQSNSSVFTLKKKRETVKEIWTTSTSVNFCAKVYPTVPVTHPDAAALAVLGGFLRNGFLHRVIREQGGAYGGGASHDSDSACFHFYSHRDPRLAETLNDFDQSVHWLLNEKHEWRQVEEAILGVIGGMDKPSSPAGEAKDAFHNTLYGRSPAQRHQHRQHILAVTLEDLQRVGKTYLKPELASVAVITNPQSGEMADELGLTLHQV